MDLGWGKSAPRDFRPLPVTADAGHSNTGVALFSLLRYPRPYYLFSIFVLLTLLKKVRGQILKTNQTRP
jgi:hypothetical protein